MASVQNNDIYGKEESKLVAGIAIILMFFHHLFGFPDFLRDDVSWQGLRITEEYTIEYAFARFCKICVALFAFNTGYAMYKNRNRLMLLNERILRLAKFLISYWVCYFFFIIYGIIVDEPMPDFINAVRNMFGINCNQTHPFVSVSFAWYVSFYIICILLSPFIIKIFNGKYIIRDIVVLIAVRVSLSIIQLFHIQCLSGLEKDIWPLFIVSASYLTAKYEVLGKIKKISIPPFGLLFCLLMVCIIGAYLRIMNLAGSITDFVEALIIVFIAINLSEKTVLRFAKKYLIFLGSYSMLLWFMHCLFFTASRPLQRLLYVSETPFVILVMAFMITIPLCLFINPISKKCQNILVAFIPKVRKSLIS